MYKDKRVLIIIPAYNEQDNIKNVVDNLVKNYPEYDYVVINDCSADNTKNICEQNNYNYLSFPVNLGIGGSVQAGYKYADKFNYDIAVQLDGDGQHDPTYIKMLINPLIEEKCDIAIGSRFLENNGFLSTSMRRIGIKFLSKLIYISSHVLIKDVTSGYRGVNNKYIKFYANEYPQDYPEPEAIVAAKLNDAVIVEIPVIMKERENGISSINKLRSIYYMFKVSLAIIICKLRYWGC